ncbi:MAG: phage tail assembly protein [Alphaproteobacteria bacterium]|nr:MAG: phage tail assembly protein [Alphaproteobacteria bacterium]
MDKHTITLDFPISHGGETYTSLSLRRPKGGDLRRGQKDGGSDIDVSFKLMASLAEVPIEAIDELDPIDLNKINDWLEPILSPKARQVASPK